LWWPPARGLSDTGAVSLQGLTDQVFDELYRARDLFGAEPQAAEFRNTPAVASAHQQLAAQHVAAGADWHGAGTDAYTDVAGAAVHRLGRVVPADHATSAAMNTVAASAATGRRLMDRIIAETHSGVAAIAPTTDTPAGARQLTEYLQNQLRRAQVVVQGGAQQSAMAAAGIGAATTGYRSGGQMPTVRGVTLKQDGPAPAPPPPPPGAAPQIGPFPVPPQVAAAAPPSAPVPPDPTGGLLTPATTPAAPAADNPLTTLLQKLTQPNPQAALTPDEIRALVDAEVQGKLNDAQRFNLWEMLKKAGAGCVLAGTAAGVGGLISGPLDPAVIAGGCVGGALTGGGGYALDHDK
jgi:Domain of unknown function (DUF4226)